MTLKERAAECPELMVECVNAHDRCFMGGPCPYCEYVLPMRDTRGRFAKMSEGGVNDTQAKVP